MRYFYRKTQDRRITTVIRREGFLNPTPVLTVIDGGQVDGFGPDGSKSGRHLQPQLVAVHPQRLDGAALLPG